jgi:hypothetical protein
VDEWASGGTGDCNYLRQPMYLAAHQRNINRMASKYGHNEQDANAAGGRIAKSLKALGDATQITPFLEHLADRYRAAISVCREVVVVRRIRV